MFDIFCSMLINWASVRFPYILFARMARQGINPFNARHPKILIFPGLLISKVSSIIDFLKLY
jgi:hypothetical protein